MALVLDSPCSPSAAMTAQSDWERLGMSRLFHPSQHWGQCDCNACVDGWWTHKGDQAFVTKKSRLAK